MSDRAFASLTPANALAKLAFSDVYDALTSRRQNNQTDGAQAALRRMLVEPEQTCDDEIVRLRREMERTKYDTDGRPCTKPSPAMTSRPESPSTTATSQDLLIDFLDIVATQGAYLVPRANTPVFQEPYDGRFAAALEQHLDALSTQQICRRVMYRDAADEWPIGRTPPEVKEKRKAEVKALEELEGVTSDDSSDNDDKDKSGNDIHARVGPGNPVAPDRPRRPRRPRQADWFPTPPLSAESPLATPHRRRRRRISEEDEEEKERSAKKHVSFAQEVSAAAEDALGYTASSSPMSTRR